MSYNKNLYFNNGVDILTRKKIDVRELPEKNLNSNETKEMDGTDNKCKEKGVKGKQELRLYSRVYLLVLSQPYPDIAAPPHPQLPAQVLIHSVGKAVNEAHAVRPLSVMGNCTLTSF